MQNGKSNSKWGFNLQDASICFDFKKPISLEYPSVTQKCVRTVTI